MGKFIAPWVEIAADARDPFGARAMRQRREYQCGRLESDVVGRSEGDPPPARQLGGLSALGVRCRVGECQSIVTLDE